MAQLVDLKVGFACNNDCIHCVISDKCSAENLSLDQIKTLIDEFIKKYKEIQLTLTGGEFSIRKDYYEILDYVKQKKEVGEITFVDLQTNARKLSDINMARAASGVVDFFLIALHSSHEDIHDKITRREGSYKQTINAIENIIRECGKEKIAIQTVINKINIKTLPDLYEQIYKTYDIKEFNITFPHPIGICKSTTVVPQYKDSQKPINEALKYCLDNGINPFLEAIPYCVMNKGSNRNYLKKFNDERKVNVVGYAGKDDGNLDYALLFDEGHRKYQSCEHCPMFNECEGVWKEYKELYSTDDLYQLYLDGEYK